MPVSGNGDGGNLVTPLMVRDRGGEPPPRA
jgi:hypothetical protein